MRDAVRTVAVLRSAGPSTRCDLILEILALHHQLAVLGRSDRRCRPSDRLFWVCLRLWWPRWRETLVLVQPATVARWQREGFRRCWSRRRPGRPRIDSDLRRLIGRMATENWLRCCRVGRSHETGGTLPVSVHRPIRFHRSNRRLFARVRRGLSFTPAHPDVSALAKIHRGLGSSNCWRVPPEISGLVGFRLDWAAIRGRDASSRRLGRSRVMQIGGAPTPRFTPGLEPQAYR
jgi:hypothetical protein